MSPLSPLKQNTIILLTISKISNTMRKIYSTLKSVVAATLVAAMAFAASCSYDDTAIKNDVEQIKVDLAALTERVANLESKLQNEIDAVKALIDGQVVIVEVTTDTDGNQTIKLSNGDEITVLAPVGCDCEPATPCQCDPLEYRVNEDGVLEVSADGVNWIAINGVTAECVVANVVVEDGFATVTLADNTSFKVAVAELVEFEAAKSAVYVKLAETVAIPFAINDAVEDINVMNQPLGWKAEIVDTRAVGGMDYVLNITGPAKNFVQYADKAGKVAIHFNTAAGACKVMSVDVELATLDLQVDKAGNVTIVNTLVDKYERENWGVTEQIEEFNNFYFAVLNLEDYYEYEGRLEEAYNSNWGEFNIPAAASYIQNFFNNVGENDYNSAIYVDGVNEKWTINFTVEEVIDYLDWYSYLTYEGNSFMLCVIPTDAHNAGELLWDEVIAVPFKQLSLKIEENVENRTFDSAYFNVVLRGGVSYHLYPMSMADINEYVEVYEYYPSMEDLFWDYLNSYLQYPNWYSFGFEITTDVVEENISLADLLSYTSDFYSFETKPATDYVMALFTWEDGKTEYSKEDLKYFYFSTADLVAAEPALEYSWDYSEDYGLYTVAVDLTVAENVSALYTRWYDSEMAESDLVDDLINNGYGRNATELEANQYCVYVGTSVDNPATTKYLGALMIDADGNYTAVQFPVTSKALIINETYTPTIDSVTFDSEGAHITVGGLEGADVKMYQYYIISTTASSYYQRTEEQCYDVAYSSDWIYQSCETNPILATRTADYTYSFSDGTYKVAVGVQFADGTYSNCVYGEFVYEQPAEELASVTAAYQESNPNYYALTLTKTNGDKITTTAGNGGVNYLNEGVWDFQLYYDSGYALGNTYVNGTQWVSDIKITVAYVEGKYDLVVRSTVGKYHYYGDIEGLVVPGYEGGDEPGEEPQPELPAEVVATSASARFSADHTYGTVVDFQLTDDFVATVVFRTGEGNWDATEYFTRGLNYIDAGVWNTYANKGTSNVWFTYAYINDEVAEIADSITVTYYDTYSFAFTINNCNVTYTGAVEGLVAPQVTGDGTVVEEPEVDLPEFVIPGEGQTFDMDYKYTTLVDGLDDSNKVRVAQENGWTWDIHFNTSLASIEAGDYTAVHHFTTNDALEVDTYNGGFQNNTYNYIYPDEFDKVTTFNVQKEGDIYCITMIGSGGWGNDVGTFRCVYIGKIE